MSENTIDLVPLVQPILEVTGLVIAGMIVRYVPKILLLVEQYLHLKFTDQQNAVFLQEVQTAAGVVETKLDQGVLNISHVDINNPEMRAAASEIIKSIPGIVDKLGYTAKEVATAIVGAVDTAPRAAPTTTINNNGVATQQPTTTVQITPNSSGTSISVSSSDQTSQAVTQV